MYYSRPEEGKTVGDVPETEQFVMRPGDTFVADECGCSFTVESGPNDPSTVRQAPTCCCGHAMRRESFGNAPTAAYRGAAEGADVSILLDGRSTPDLSAR
jgi:hypothetical protein